MEADLREALRRAIALEQTLFLETQKHEREAAHWQQRTDLALRRGELDLSRQALDRQRQEEQRVDHYRDRYWAQVAFVREAKQLARYRRVPVPPAAPLFPAEPVPVPDLEERLARLDQDDRLERDLAALKHQLASC